jgi:hypothetical protein
MDRVMPAGLGEKLEHAKKTTVDIGEHLDLLRDLAAQCEHVTEFGVRNADGSTVALLAGQPETLISYDVNPWAAVNQNVADLLMLGAHHPSNTDPNARWRVGRTFFQPRIGDTLTMSVIEPTDLLFIDTIHHAKHLQAELIRHADPVANTVRKFLVFHDTVTFGYVSDDGNPPGLRDAIRWFQRCHAFPIWEVVEDRQNCNGLVVLKNVRAK